MRPSAAAKVTGVSTDSLRHYERLGLLPGVTRSANGYRRYSDETLRRVLLIQRALVVGFSLDDLRRILATRDRGGTPCHGVRTLVSDKLVALEARITELLDLRDELRRLVKAWDRTLAETPAGQPAHLLESLGQKGPIEHARQRRMLRSRRDSRRGVI